MRRCPVNFHFLRVIFWSWGWGGAIFWAPFFLASVEVFLVGIFRAVAWGIRWKYDGVTVSRESHRKGRHKVTSLLVVSCTLAAIGAQIHGTPAQPEAAVQKNGRRPVSIGQNSRDTVPDPEH